MGSLVAALGSFLDARSNQGQWLLRMEDLDPPREMAGAKDIIPQQLAEHGLLWDGEITYQSHRLDLYDRYIYQLKNKGMLFACNCSRQRIREIGGLYDQRCRNRGLDPSGDVAIRVKLDESVFWKDLIQGNQSFTPEKLNGDFIIKRRDGLFSYQLAVAVDDAVQGMTHIIRGADLLDSAARQRYLQQLLGLQSPEYGHLPLVENSQGQKLSKQAHARPLDSAQTNANLCTALGILGQNPPKELCQSSVEEILNWAIEKWKLDAVPRVSIRLDSQ